MKKEKTTNANTNRGGRTRKKMVVCFSVFFLAYCYDTPSVFKYAVAFAEFYQDTLFISSSSISRQRQCANAIAGTACWDRVP